jgi:phosphomannomutase
VIKHFFFDLDKTLTTSRSPMAPAHAEVFARLVQQRDVVVVTGGSVDQIREQVTPQFDGRYYLLAQSGNQLIDKTGAVLWSEVLSPEQVAAVYRYIDTLRTHFAISVRDKDDIVENRGAQIAYSVLGFHEDIAKKYAFDPDQSKRNAALDAFAEERAALLALGVEVIPAGTTNFSFLPAGKHKGFNVARFIEKMGWIKEECVYVGDALFPGGNDETVNGVIPTKQVESPDDTFKFITEMLD